MAPEQPLFQPPGDFRRLSAVHNFITGLRWSLTRTPPPWPGPEILTQLQPTRPPSNIQNYQGPPRAVWLGHSSVLLQMDGRNLLTDPVFGPRVGPFSRLGLKRLVPPALGLNQLPPIDYVLISHDHYDHLEAATVKALGNRVLWLLPPGLSSWFKRRGVSRIRELTWGQRVKIDGWTFECLPAQHFSGRYPWDRNRTGWCSWLISNHDRKIWFAGDTGFDGELFSTIGQNRGPLDLALIPIGSYAPAWFMRPVHLSPEEACQTHQLVRARRSLAIHWGSFILSDEPVLEPAERLQRACQRLGLRDFHLLRPGETLEF